MARLRMAMSVLVNVPSLKQSINSSMERQMTRGRWVAATLYRGAGEIPINEDTQACFCSNQILAELMVGLIDPRLAEPARLDLPANRIAENRLGFVDPGR